MEQKKELEMKIMLICWNLLGKVMKLLQMNLFMADLSHLKPLCATEISYWNAVASSFKPFLWSFCFSRLNHHLRPNLHSSVVEKKVSQLKLHCNVTTSTENRTKLTCIVMVWKKNWSKIFNRIKSLVHAKSFLYSSCFLKRRP